ncbi:hypothetical protein CIG2463D_1512 [Campylobacter iguaniorum]|uniref:hypothetical protein n=1 Tax=Campylobacter iguaniorum TaxID=1244531 RepID=UPI00073A3659|nr:hypothetical protein [Campylobacter iguaniorum]ALV25077.1 hypothetical protein CIG2463D_1512 [Campylobacter iguaniorum]
MELFNEKQALSYLGYSAKSNILAQMRMKSKKDKWEFVPRFITLNGQIRYPKGWLDEDLAQYAQKQIKN